METIDGPDLHAEVRELAAGRNFAAVATLLPDGRPQNQLTWIDTDGTHLLVNTPVSTQKRRNVARDPRITIAVWNRDNPFQYAEIRGDVVDTIEGEQAWEHIDQVARRYGGDGYGLPRHDRVVLVIRPRRQLLARPPRF